MNDNTLYLASGKTICKWHEDDHWAGGTKLQYLQHQIVSWRMGVVAATGGLSLIASCHIEGRPIQVPAVSYGYPIRNLIGYSLG